MYTITFIDGSKFEGGNPSDSKWDKMGNLPIKSIEYSLTPFIKYRFRDFDSYNHCVERVKGVNKSIDLISKVIIMGSTKNRVYQIILDKDGQVFQTVVPYGKEYSPYSKIVNGKFAGWSNPKPLAGWKHGVVDGAPKLQKIFIRNGVETVEE